MKLRRKADWWVPTLHDFCELIIKVRNPFHPSFKKDFKKKGVALFSCMAATEKTYCHPMTPCIWSKIVWKILTLWSWLSPSKYYMYDQRPVEQLPGCYIYHLSLHLPKLIKVNVFSLQFSCLHLVVVFASFYFPQFKNYVSIYSLLLCHLFFLRPDFVALIVWNWLRRLQTFHLKCREILELAFSRTGFLHCSQRLSFVFAFLVLCAKNVKKLICGFACLKTWWQITVQ